MNKQDKHFDIASAGSIPASHTSRPIIVGNSKQVQDPMVSDVSGSSTAQNSSLRHNVTIKPPETTEQETTHTEEATPKIGDSGLEEKNDVVDDSIVDSAVSPPPIQATQDPVDDLISNKTYQLPIHHFGKQSKASFVFYSLITAIAVGAALFVILS